MPKPICVEVERPGDAKQLAERLRVHGFDAGGIRSLAGTPEVIIRRPLLRRKEPFMVGVESIVRRWLEEDVPTLDGVTLRVGDERTEITSPVATASFPVSSGSSEARV